MERRNVRINYCKFKKINFYIFSLFSVSVQWESGGILIFRKISHSTHSPQSPSTMNELVHFHVWMVCSNIWKCWGFKSPIIIIMYEACQKYYLNELDDFLDINFRYSLSTISQTSEPIFSSLINFKRQKLNLFDQNNMEWKMENSSSF